MNGNLNHQDAKGTKESGVFYHRDTEAQRRRGIESSGVGRARLPPSLLAI
jgi:hypothetical protein